MIEKQAIVGRLQRRDLPAVASYRNREGWTLAETDCDNFWLKVPTSDESLLEGLPLLGLWFCSEDNHLFREGHSVPDHRVETEWCSFAEVIAIGKVLRTLPAMSPLPIGFSLVATENTAATEAILSTWSDFTQWSETVLRQRIECLKFALSEEGRCLVQGTPLPGMSGEGYYRKGQLWLPCGYALPDFLWPEIVEQAMNLKLEEQAIIFPEGDWSYLPADAWLPASRAAVRINRSLEHR
ncbi:MAG: hypothetical protein AAF226_03945 [Verrucomicrobiota bacterium]